MTPHDFVNMTPHEFVKRLCELLGPGYGIYNARISNLITSEGNGEVFSCSVLHRGAARELVIVPPLEEVKAVSGVNNIRSSFGYLVPSDMYHSLS